MEVFDYYQLGHWSMAVNSEHEQLSLWSVGEEQHLNYAILDIKGINWDISFFFTLKYWLIVLPYQWWNLEGLCCGCWHCYYCYYLCWNFSNDSMSNYHYLHSCYPLAYVCVSILEKNRINKKLYKEGLRKIHNISTWKQRIKQNHIWNVYQVKSFIELSNETCQMCVCFKITQKNIFLLTWMVSFFMAIGRLTLWSL